MTFTELRAEPFSQSLINSMALGAGALVAVSGGTAQASACSHAYKEGHLVPRRPPSRPISFSWGRSWPDSTSRLGVFDGARWRDLGATCNPRGRYTRKRGGCFVRTQYGPEARDAGRVCARVVEAVSAAFAGGFSRCASQVLPLRSASPRE